MKKIFLSFIILLLFTLLFNTCKSGYEVSIKPFEVELVADKEIDNHGGEFSLKITTTGNWKIKRPTTETWYSFSSIAGRGNKTVILKVSVNEEERRTGKFDISVGTEKIYIEFTQNKFIEEDTYSPMSDASRIEIPRLSDNVANNNAAFVVHYSEDNVGESILNYSLEYNYASHHSRWVAFTFYDLTSEVNTKRTNAWSTDPYLLNYTDNAYDFRGSGYDRGHLVASADRLYSIPANEQTFYYSNMSPQINSFNGGIWASLENMVQGWGKLSAIRDTLYVAKGGTIREDQVMGTIGENKIVIPKYYFMALLTLKGATFKSIAFMFEHKSYAGGYQLSDYALSVEELEKQTGIDFFHNLPDSIEHLIEKQMNTEDWPGL